MKIFSLIILFTVLLTWHLTEADLISDVCGRESNPAPCDKVLRSDPRSRGANLVGLGQISIELSEKATKDVIAVARSVESKDNKGYIDQCLESLDDAVSSINKCKGFLKSGDFKSFYTFASSGFNAVFFCGDDAFEGKPIPGKLIQSIDFAKPNLDALTVVGLALSSSAKFK